MDQDCLDPTVAERFASGVLSEAEHSQVARHLADCSRCASMVAAMGPTDPPASDPFIAQVIGGRYRVEGRLGEGGMGMVYAAQHLRLPRRVAVKVLSDQFKDAPEALTRFQNEARICASLGSQHVVDVFDFETLQDGRSAIVMELLHGEDLAQRIVRGGALTPTEALHIGSQICSALIVTHEAGILHRDLKPSNIFLCLDAASSEAFVKLLDFGIAKARRNASALTAAGQIMGTPHYMSPEQATDAASIDARADLFSLGAIMYHALAGKVPFTGDSIMTVLWKVAHAEPIPLEQCCPQCPPALRRLLDRLLEKDPAQRPADAREVKAEFDRIAQGEPRRMVAPTVLSPALLKGPDRKRRLWLAAALLGATAAVGLILLGLYSSSTTRDGKVGGQALRTQSRASSVSRGGAPTDASRPHHQASSTARAGKVAVDGSHRRSSDSNVKTPAQKSTAATLKNRKEVRAHSTHHKRRDRRHRRPAAPLEGKGPTVSPVTKGPATQPAAKERVTPPQGKTPSKLGDGLFEE